jgi:hypothetical protein
MHRSGRRRRVATLFALGASSIALLAACAHRPSRRAAPSTTVFEQQRAETRSWARKAIVVPECGGVETPPSFDNDGPCGLISAEVFHPDFVHVFAARVCSGSLDATCEERHQQMFFARVEERYTHADYDAVDRHCQAWPLKCQSARDLELIVLASHNDSVRANGQSRLAQIDADEERAFDRAERREHERLERERFAEDDERRRTMAFTDGMSRLANVLKESQPKPPPPTQQTRCTSERRFGRVETQCTTNQQ